MFTKGLNCFFTGLTRFYSDRSLIKYAVFPLLLMLGSTLLFLILAVMLTSYQTAKLEQWISALPSFISWAAPVLSAGAIIAAAVITFVIAILAATTVYEAFSGPFFDTLIKNYERKYHNLVLPDIPLKRGLCFLLQALLYNINTLLLSLILLLPSLLIPFLGPLVLCLIAGYRVGITYMLPSGFLHNRSIKEQLVSAQGKKACVLGFGITVYLLFLLPFLSLLLLPGVILGGTELFHCLNDDKK